jgi:hypothetical protein
MLDTSGVPISQQGVTVADKKGPVMPGLFGF